MTKQVLFGGLLAVGLMAFSSNTASAQFVTPFGVPGPGGNFGAVYPTPSGGIVQQSTFQDPFTGNVYLNKTYSNPFTGTIANRSAFIPRVNPFMPFNRPPAVFSGYGFRSGFGSYGYRYFR